MTTPPQGNENEVRRIVRLPLDEIAIDAGTQTRAATNDETVADYTEAMHNGADFPAVVVFHDGTTHYLADGFHRILAARRVKLLEFDAEVRTGTKEDALRYALGANVTNGLRRSNADKRRCVEIALKTWPDISDRSVAELCGVEHHLVAQVRQLGESPSSPAPRKGRDGKVRRMPTPTKAKTNERPKGAPVVPAPQNAKEEKNQKRYGTLVVWWTRRGLQSKWQKLSEDRKNAFIRYITEGGGQ